MWGSRPRKDRLVRRLRQDSELSSGGGENGSSISSLPMYNDRRAVNEEQALARSPASDRTRCKPSRVRFTARVERPATDSAFKSSDSFENKGWAVRACSLQDDSSKDWSLVRQDRGAYEVQERMPHPERLRDVSWVSCLTRKVAPSSMCSQSFKSRAVKVEVSGFKHDRPMVETALLGTETSRAPEQPFFSDLDTNHPSAASAVVVFPNALVV
mmetsp:Transcript_49685/g.82487  ORF Transcript_49685/g.82487 Transcript_49685/m.82487 type:complete len:213 (+) Transcript_49685:849-1487(+)